MAENSISSSSAVLVRRDGDWLLPYNRRLRNLVSISVRNLSLATTSSSRLHRKTIDDDAIPHTLRSPAKLVALREHKTFSHSRSSSDLRALAENAISESEDVNASQSFDGSPGKNKHKHRPQSTATATARRPEFRRLRRSTSEWTNATSQARQEKLEDVADEHMADVFFSLHVRGLEEPVYVSETVQRTMNPTFRQIDWSSCGPGITRAEYMTLRLWVLGANTSEWRQLMDLKLHLKQFRYLGKSLDTLEEPLPPNAVLFHMADAIYTTPTDSFADFAPKPSPPIKAVKSTSPRQLPTSSFDALLRLAKLDDSIQDALATRNRIAEDLEKLLQTNRDALLDRDQLTEGKDRLETIKFAKLTVERQLEKARRQKSEKSASLSARPKLMKSDTTFRAGSEEQMAKRKPDFPGMQDEHETKKKAIQNQRRRICEELQACFPILPRPGKALAFTIRGLHLPNSEDLDSEPPEVVSAALGHVAQVLLLVSFYHSHPLPYPVNPRGSSSTVVDPISILKTNTPIPSADAEQTLRTYPLFSKGVPRFRFEYAVFLLNQDIRILLEGVFNVRVIDVRQTLPNLKYLLYVATAGEGELPARKAGGVRGLLRAPVHRVGSSDSTSSTLSGLTLQGNGKPVDAVESLKRLGR